MRAKRKASRRISTATRSKLRRLAKARPRTATGRFRKTTRRGKGRK